MDAVAGLAVAAFLVSLHLTSPYPRKQGIRYAAVSLVNH